MAYGRQDKILEILSEAKEISNVIRRKNCFDCIIKTRDDHGEESVYTVTFGENEISAKNNMTGEFFKDYEYDKNVFLTAIYNYNNLLDIPNPIDNRYHFNILNIIFDRANHKNNFSGDEYTDDFSGDECIEDLVMFINKTNFINKENYFLFLKITCEGRNFQLFEYLKGSYPEYFNDLSEEQKSILSGSACFGGNSNIIHSLEDLKFDFSYNALKGAIAGKNFNIFEWLLNCAKNVVDINTKGRKFGETILHYVILSNLYDYPLTNYPEALESIVFNYSVADDYTKHKPTVIEYLLSFPGIDINAQANGGYTALHFAIKKGDRQLIDYLISQPNINMNLKDREGNSLLHYFITVKDIDMVKKLIDDPNIDINIQDKNGRTPLQRFIMDGNIEMIEKLIYNPKINVNIRDNSGSTALHFAARGKNEDIFKLILFNPEININVQDQYNETPLDDAIMYGNYEIAKILLSSDEIDVNVKDHLRNTVLHDAIRRNNLEIVELLLKKENIEVNAINNNKETPLIIAAIVCKDDLTIPQLLIKKGAKVNDDRNDLNQPLKSAIFFKNKKMVDFLEENGADFNIPIRKYGYPYKYSIFMEAIDENQRGVIKFILDNCIDKIDINRPYYHGHTALTEAINVGNIELAELLITKYGARITDTDIDVVEDKERKYNDVNKHAFFRDRTFSVDLREEELKRKRIKRKKSEFVKKLKQYKIEQDLRQTTNSITPKNGKKCFLI